MKRINLMNLPRRGVTPLLEEEGKFRAIFGKDGGKIQLICPADLAYRYLVVDTTVEAEHSVALELNFFNPGADEFKLGYRFGLLPGLKTRVCIDLALIDSRTIFTPRTPGTLKMVVHGNRMEPDEVDKIEFGIHPCVDDVTLLLEDAYLSDEMPAEFPIPEGKYVDEFGQWTGRDWPGKIHTEEELRESLLALRQNGKPLATRTKWGGEAARKLCEGKGFFKTLKTPDGRWHLVDPDGYDFYSLGVDCIRPGDNPRIDQYPSLCELPPEPWASMCGDERFIRYTEANLRRVFGEDWKAAFREISENVLLEGGWNTVANWSDEIFRTGEKRLPYVWQPDIFPTTELKIFRDFPDVLSEEYQKDAIRRAEALREAKDDPWQIGYFLRNEPEFAFVPNLLIADEAIRNPADSACKRGILQKLEEKYGDIAALNAVWGSGFASFEEIGEQRAGIETRFPGAKADLKELSVYLVEAYVGIPSKACRGVDPNHLNLGMRWAVANSPEQVAGWQNFDVFSLNNYSFDPTPLMNFAVGCGVDLPLMIGEFHFGALDRGLPATGLKGTASQTDRAKALRGYIEKAAAHPNAVGVHWFQFCDQNIAGRFDGENYQIGLVDVALRPYPEMMAASRESAMALPGVTNGEISAFDEPFEEIPMIGS